MNISCEDPCPNCGKMAVYWSDTFNTSGIVCYHCGLIIEPHIKYLTLEELNEVREDNEMRLLKKLPKQTLKFE